MLPLLPYRSYTIGTALRPLEFLERLENDLQPPLMFRQRLLGQAKGFQGSVGENEFRIRRQINYRNSFLPNVTGRIESIGEGSRIHVRMTLQPLVIAICIVWLFGVGMAALFSAGAIMQNGFAKPAALIPIGMLIFFYVLTTAAFGFEASRAERYLDRISHTGLNDER